MREEGIATQNVALSETLKVTAYKEVEERIIKNYLDIIILKALKNEPLGGYAILSVIHRKFDVLLSAGTVYSLVYSLERKGLVKASFNGRTRYYTLTEKGEETLRVIMTMQNKLKALADNIF